MRICGVVRIPIPHPLDLARAPANSFIQKTDMVAAEERRLAAKAEEAKAGESGKSSEPKKN